ncbi:Uncharacterized protein SCF082_LOCUS25352 [Durusdinium trenchii]|uniref:PPIase FKBP-type domain-containing protein n=1 Tax=Durusdinium trenchii TaxID=1381693 RepID=A0ABP0LZM3_9DINO
MIRLLLAAYILGALAARSGKGGASPSISILSGPPDEAAWQGVKVTDVMPGFRVQEMKPTQCSQQVRRGDAVRILLRAQTGPQHVEQATSKDDAEQSFILGKHNIPAINKGMVGMCPGSVRRISVDSHAIDYTVNLVEIKSGPLRIKDVL